MQEAHERSPLMGGGESSPQKQAGAGLDNKPHTGSPSDVTDDPELQKQAECVRNEVQQAKSNRFCFAIGGVAVFCFCLILVFAAYVLLSKPEDQDVLEAFVGKNWPWVLSFVFFSSFTGALLWKIDHTDQKIDQMFDHTDQKIDQKFDHTGQMLENIHTLMKRQHEENNLVMSSTYLVQNVTKKINPAAFPKG